MITEVVCLQGVLSESISWGNPYLNLVHVCYLGSLKQMFVYIPLLFVSCFCLFALFCFTLFLCVSVVEGCIFVLYLCIYLPTTELHHAPLSAVVRNVMGLDATYK